MRVHEFKAWSEVFDALWRGVKRFEFRNVSDRDHPVIAGDFLEVHEWERETMTHDAEATGRIVVAFADYVLSGPEFGVPEGCQVISLDVRELRDAD